MPSDYMIVMQLRFCLGGKVAEGVELFPLIHEIADLPHQALVAVDHRLGAGAILLEPRGRHLLFDLPDGGFGLCDAGLQCCNSRLAGVGDFLLLARFRVHALLLVVALRFLGERDALIAMRLGAGS